MMQFDENVSDAQNESVESLIFDQLSNENGDVVLGLSMLAVMRRGGITPSVVNDRLVIKGARPNQHEGLRRIIEHERQILAALATPTPPGFTREEFECAAVRQANAEEPYIVTAALLRRARATGMVVYRRLAGSTRQDVELRPWLTIRGRNKDEALADELMEHRRIALELLEHEALMKLHTKTARRRRAAYQSDTFTEIELRRLEFMKWRLAHQPSV
jgi:hypothetical protein